uniref:Uncharacterized protein n=1 Tax=Leersia perrieri TaxID=77586 RepID=A0A0D9VS80_9ORYZ
MAATIPPPSQSSSTAASTSTSPVATGANASASALEDWIRAEDDIVGTEAESDEDDDL